MQQSTEVVPSSISSSFAGLLAALASPASVAPNGSGGADRAPAWNSDHLSEDVATLSYESALRAHARYRPVNRADWPLPAAAKAHPGEAQQVPPDAAPAAEGLPAWASAAAQDAIGQELRKASVTIRLSDAECAQLHERAAEAGMTVSAYLRSCTFEAEALRAQVKEALAVLLSAASQPRRAAPVKQRRSWFGWLLRLLPHRHARQQIVPA